MFAVSADFKNAYESGAEQDILLTFADGSTIGKSDISITSGGLTITEYMNPDEDLTIGTASMAELKVTLLNKNGKFNSFNFAQTFYLQFGVMVNGAFEYIPLGKWIGTRPEKVKTNIIEFTAQDCMKVLDKSAQDMLEENLPFPISYLLYVLLVEAGIGSYVAADITLPVNGTKPVKKHHFRSTDYTYREVTAMIAEATGGYSRTEYYNSETEDKTGARYRIKPFETVDYTVGRKRRFALSVSDFPAPRIDKLEVYTSYSDKLVTSGTGDNVYVISDNPLLYAENDDDTAELQPYVDALYGVLSALPEYYPASLRAVGVPWLECGDIITVIDDNDEELVFPIFTKTMTWNGSWMMELENTGGQTRQIAPVEQRELENLKKNMLQNADLATEIESYINSEEGVASIMYAVSGKFMEKPIEPVYSTPSDVTYGFEKTSDGYYTSTNAGVANSFSYGKFTFNSPEARTVTLRCISYGETSYDYGLISTLNSNLAQDIVADTSNVLYNFYGKSSADPIEISLDIPAGESFITFKYRKDSITDSNGDYFKIMVVGGEFATTAEVSSIIEQSINAFEANLKLSVSNGSKSSTILLKSGNITLSSQTIQFTGEVVFKSDLSTAGSTTINGANIMTGTISAESLLVKNVFFNEPDNNGNNISILTSEKFSENNMFIHLGLQQYMNGYTDALQMIQVHATDIFFFPPGETWDGNSLRIDTRKRRLMPQTAGTWSVGKGDCPFTEMFAHFYTIVDAYDNPIDNYVDLYYTDGVLWADLNYGNGRKTVKLASY